MKNFMFYLFSVGLAFFVGLKMTSKPSTIVKVVTKEVKVEDKLSLQKITQLEFEIETCVKNHNKLVSETNHKVKNIEAQLETCIENYSEEKPTYKPTLPNIETVRKKEPTMSEGEDD